MHVAVHHPSSHVIDAGDARLAVHLDVLEALVAVTRFPGLLALTAHQVAVGLYRAVGQACVAAVVDGAVRPQGFAVPQGDLGARLAADPEPSPARGDDGYLNTSVPGLGLVI